jgi:hypothetical protein
VRWFSCCDRLLRAHRIFREAGHIEGQFWGTSDKAYIEHNESAVTQIAGVPCDMDFRRNGPKHRCGLMHRGKLVVCQEAHMSAAEVASSWTVKATCLRFSYGEEAYSY